MLEVKDLYTKYLIYVIFKLGGNMECLFCKINEDLIPSHTLFEDDIVRVIMDIYPSSDGHILIIPKKHIEDFMDLDNSTIIHIFEVAKKMKEYLYTTLNPDGLTLTINYGIKQEIKHFHLHLVPAYKNRDLHDLEMVFEKIKKQINLSNLMN